MKKIHTTKPPFLQEKDNFLIFYNNPYEEKSAALKKLGTELELLFHGHTILKREDLLTKKEITEYKDKLKQLRKYCLDLSTEIEKPREGLSEIEGKILQRKQKNSDTTPSKPPIKQEIQSKIKHYSSQIKVSHRDKCEFALQVCKLLVDITEQNSIRAERVEKESTEAQKAKIQITILKKHCSKLKKIAAWIDSHTPKKPEKNANHYQEIYITELKLFDLRFQCDKKQDFQEILKELSETLDSHIKKKARHNLAYEEAVNSNKHQSELKGLEPGKNVYVDSRYRKFAFHYYPEVGLHIHHTTTMNVQEFDAYEEERLKPLKSSQKNQPSGKQNEILPKTDIFTIRGSSYGVAGRKIFGNDCITKIIYDEKWTPYEQARFFQFEKELQLMKRLNHDHPFTVLYHCPSHVDLIAGCLLFLEGKITYPVYNQYLEAVTKRAKARRNILKTLAKTAEAKIIIEGAFENIGLKGLLGCFAKVLALPLNLEEDILESRDLARFILLAITTGNKNPLQKKTWEKVLNIKPPKGQATSIRPETVDELLHLGNSLMLAHATEMIRIKNSNGGKTQKLQVTSISTYDEAPILNIYKTWLAPTFGEIQGMYILPSVLYYDNKQDNNLDRALPETYANLTRKELAKQIASCYQSTNTWLIDILGETIDACTKKQLQRDNLFAIVTPARFASLSNSSSSFNVVL